MGTKKNNFSINSYDDQIMGIKIKTIFSINSYGDQNMGIKLKRFTINPYNRSNHGQKKSSNVSDLKPIPSILKADTNRYNVTKMPINL